jgi:hypothetical protein
MPIRPNQSLSQPLTAVMKADLILVTGRASRRFKFQKRCQPFIRSHNETLSVAEMRIGNEDCWPAGRDHIMISALVS